jgi:type II secretory pathway predicted ATPase ExeA
MLSDVMAYFTLVREFDQAGYFATDHHHFLLKEMAATIKKGRIIVLAGIVGCGKTKVLLQLQQVLKRENAVLVARSLAVDKSRVTLNVLMLALNYGLTTDETASALPKQPELREHHLVAVLQKHQKPAVLFVDDAHDLNPETLTGLKRLIETARDNGATLSLVLAGHPQLKHELRRPTFEEIGARTVIFTLEGIQGQQRAYIEWLLTQCTTSKTQRDTLMADDAIELLAERLATPLQIEHYLTLAFEEAFHIGQKPVTVDLINRVLAKTLNAPEPHLIRHGYHVKSLAQLINVKPAEIRSFLHNQLPPGRAQELKEQLLLAGVPL